jgi:hypothetical protein
MRMFIPEIGTRLTLEQDWTFMLHEEYRNASIWDKLKAADPDTFAEIKRRSDEEKDKFFAFRDMPQRFGTREEQEKFDADRTAQLQLWQDQERVEVTLPAGTVLTLDRLYIRKGASGYSSASFNLNETTHEALNIRGKKRFWAKLHDVNRIEFQALPDAEDAPGLG